MGPVNKKWKKKKNALQCKMSVDIIGRALLETKSNSTVERQQPCLT